MLLPPWMVAPAFPQTRLGRHPSHTITHPFPATCGKQNRELVLLQLEEYCISSRCNASASRRVVSMSGSGWQATPSHNGQLDLRLAGSGAVPDAEVERRCAKVRATRSELRPGQPLRCWHRQRGVRVQDVGAVSAHLARAYPLTPTRTTLQLEEVFNSLPFGPRSPIFMTVDCAERGFGDRLHRNAAPPHVLSRA